MPAFPPLTDEEEQRILSALTAHEVNKLCIIIVFSNLIPFALYMQNET